jgi:hypothetical protein
VTGRFTPCDPGDGLLRVSQDIMSHDELVACGDIETRTSVSSGKVSAGKCGSRGRRTLLPECHALDEWRQDGTPGVGVDRYPVDVDVADKTRGGRP